MREKETKGPLGLKVDEKLLDQKTEGRIVFFSLFLILLHFSIEVKITTLRVATFEQASGWVHFVLHILPLKQKSGRSPRYPHLIK